jgi:hypothetical protein
MQNNDRVRKKTGEGKGNEGVVVEVSDDGRKVKVKADDETLWKMQSADNFEKLGGRAPAERPARAEGEEKKELTGGWWAAGKNEGYPPELGGVYQKEARVGACVRVDKDGVQWWSDNRIGSREEYEKWAAALDNKYPRLDKHWCETVQYRTAQCKKARDYCWNKLDRHTLGKVWQDRTKLALPSRLGADLFRVDMFNNVVMNECSTKAVCAWEVDHIFPWARGGCSVQTNFAGVQWGANNKKRDKIIQGMDLGPECASELQVGLSPDAFVTLFMFCEQVLPHTRQNVRAWQDRAVYFLRGSPMVGQAKVNLAETLGHGGEKALASRDPARLWKLFEQLMNPQIAPPPPPPPPPTDSVASLHDTALATAEKSRQDMTTTELLASHRIEGRE